MSGPTSAWAALLRPRIFARAPQVRGRGPFTRVSPRTWRAARELAEAPAAVAANDAEAGAARGALGDAPAAATALVLTPAADIGPRFAASREEREHVKEILESARSAATRRAYSGDWERFLAWCDTRHAEALPAAPDVVVVYLRTLLAEKKGIATIERALASISMAHAAGGFERPRRAELVRQFMRGLRRHTRERPRRRAKAIELEDLKRMIDKTPGSTSAGLRDRALLLLGFFGAFRRSELAALDKADLADTREGLVVHLRWSKTDQEGEGQMVGIPLQQDERYCAVRAVKAWLELRSDDTSALFIALDRRCDGARLKPQAVERILEAAAKRAGLMGRFTPHSLRAGFATAAARAGASERSIMKQTRHKSVSVLHGYIREANVFVGNSARLT